ncbi:MAG: hypothetical protein COT73_10935 [Bdellovibrio sp. CG10_big_fil_rev_8_21_14_0_10_47_8]|nr:MAG: hypothetical protein COT73_10935 [Bdellovibrio sp. CG10_big_fil_rev_8_21_14_0_10_47_8]
MFQGMKNKWIPLSIFGMVFGLGLTFTQGLSAAPLKLVVECQSANQQVFRVFENPMDQSYLFEVANTQIPARFSARTPSANWPAFEALNKSLSLTFDRSGLPNAIGQVLMITELNNYQIIDVICRTPLR